MSKYKKYQKYYEKTDEKSNELNILNDNSDELDIDNISYDQIYQLVLNDLSNKGYFVGSGSKFGCDLRISKSEDAEHSYGCIYIIKSNDVINGYDINSFVRLSETVNKIGYLAIVNNNLTIEYIKIQTFDISISH